MEEYSWERDQKTKAWTHAIAGIEPGMRLHYVTAGKGERVIVLLHGFPQTWWEWRHVIPELTDAGFSVIAPDYRGAGHSQRPQTGYDKRTMAGDIYRVLRPHSHIESPIIFLSHHIGLMVAYAYAPDHPDEGFPLVITAPPPPPNAPFHPLRS